METSRWELFRVLSEPIRLRLLAIAQRGEWSIGEFADILSESQPNVSKHVASLRRFSLLSIRKDGVRTMVRAQPGSLSDPVISEAVREGQDLLRKERLEPRIAQVLRARETASFDYFAKVGQDQRNLALTAELPAYLSLFSLMFRHRKVAVDVGTGDGRLLDLLCPIYEQVFAVDRSKERLALAQARVQLRGYNVHFRQDAIEDPKLADAIHAQGGADLVVASRILHHAASPQETLGHLVKLLSPHGTLAILDYLPHEDETMRDKADQWLGLSPEDLCDWATRAGLTQTRFKEVPTELVSQLATEHDRHLSWFWFVAER